MKKIAHLFCGDVAELRKENAALKDRIAKLESRMTKAYEILLCDSDNTAPLKAMYILEGLKDDDPNN